MGNTSEEPELQNAEQSDQMQTQAADSSEAVVSTDGGNSAADRMARFKALKARNAESRKENMKDSTQEAKRMATDYDMLNKLQRKRETATGKLIKADTEAAGEDFERKRAWDWTIEESERWDRRMEKKARHRDNVHFANYHEDARKVYKRQMKGVKVDMQNYSKEKAEALQKAAQRGELEIIEAEDGELIAVDKDGNLFSTDDTADFTLNKPNKDAVDRLVEDLKKADEARMKKRRERGLKDDADGDVTYINEKNKQFNEKLARFYNKYTADIRESFERGTAI